MNFLAKFFKPRNFLISAIIIQIIFFCLFAFLTRGSWLRGDNFLYEFPAWNWASGNGLTLHRNEWEDPYLTELHYATHPEKIGNDFIPAVTFPVGYSYFLGTIFTFAGRNHLAAIIANLILLCATVWVMYSIARRTFGEKIEFYFSMCLIGMFPLWAYWASAVLSDTLHLFLVTLFAFVFFVDKPSFQRILISGIILGLAAVVRPYVTLLPVALLIGGWIFNCKAFNLKNMVTVAILCWAVLGCSVVKNYYEFGKPIITAKGLGDGLWLSTQKKVFNDYMTKEEMERRITALGVSSPHRYRENQKLLEEAIRQIKERPFYDALVTLSSMPRLWISLGGENTGGLGKVALVISLASMLVLMLIGGFLARKSQNLVLIGAVVICSYYTVVFAHLNNEGRYVIPARFFSFLLISLALAHFLRLYSPRFSRVQPDAM